MGVKSIHVRRRDNRDPKQNKGDIVNIIQTHLKTLPQYKEPPQGIADILWNTRCHSLSEVFDRSLDNQTAPGLYAKELLSIRGRAGGRPLLEKVSNDQYAQNEAGMHMCVHITSIKTNVQPLEDMIPCTHK